MALATTILNQIRDEIGSDDDYSEAALEEIYVDENRGNYSVLVTALIVWKRRLHDLQSRSFDISVEGSLLNRSQRARQIKQRIMELELIVDRTLRGENMETVSGLTLYPSNYSGAEF